MAKTIWAKKRFFGFSDFIKDEVEPDHYYFAQSIDYRSDPNSLTLLPSSLLESGSVVTDLLKFADIVPSDLSVYSVGSMGGFYKRTSTGSWSLLRSVVNAHGNGVSYFAGDDYVYYPIDSTIGRYGPISNNPQFSDTFLETQGGVRLNTYSATFVAASSQYATKTDTASLSITGNLTAECYINPASLPTVGNSMILMSKWRSGNNTRSYKFDIAGVSAVFGDGSDSNLTISSNTTEAPIDSACSGTTGLNSLSATNVSFASGQEILIHQSQGTNAGTYMRNKIISYTAGTITLDQALNQSYVTGAQVLVLKQYGNVTVNSGVTWTAKSWNGTTGGILGFLCNGTFTCTGSINATGCGFRGGLGAISAGSGYQGEGTAGVGSVSVYANGNAGGGGTGSNDGGADGGSGSNGSSGSNGNSHPNSTTYGIGATLISSNLNLTTMTFGGAGGGGGADDSGGTNQRPTGGNGGGIIFIYANSVSITGSIVANGLSGVNQHGTSNVDEGGCGAAGSILIKSITVVLGTNLVTAIGGVGVNVSAGYGRNHVDYYTSVTGTTTPTLDSAQDNNLSTNTTYQLRLWISQTGTTTVDSIHITNGGTGYTAGALIVDNTGTGGTGFAGSYTVDANGVINGGAISNHGSGYNTPPVVTPQAGGSNAVLTPMLLINQEVLARTCGLTIGVWKHVAVTWTAASHIAEFFLNGTSLGTSSGAYTAISDNGSSFVIGSQDTDLGSYYNGQMDEVRLWNVVRSVSDIYNYKDTQISPTANGLAAYYQLNNLWSDSTANANDLTATNTPTFTTNTPFLSPSTRLDIDLSQTATGQTYTVPLAISETIANAVYFTPQSDPLKSISVLIAAKGTGNWTLTLHDSTNTVVAQDTEYNSSGTVLLDSYSESNYYNLLTLNGMDSGTYLSLGQSFKNVNQIILNSCKFYLEPKVKNPSIYPTGNAYAKIFSMSGNFGVDGIPTGDPLAISEPINVATITTLALYEFTFIGSNQITLEGNTNYFVTIEYNGKITNGTGIYVGSDSSSPLHQGNAASFNTTWSPITDDICFYVYGNYVNTLNTGQFEFKFANPVRFQIGKTYHFHLTSTVADGTVTTNTTANLSTVDYKTYFQILVTDTDFHPIVPFLNFEVIGNERYLATWNGVFYEPNLITLPPQTSVRCFAFWRNYLAIGTWRRKTTGATNIYDWDRGRIYFWDGISLSFNFWIDVPEGQINAMVGDNNLLYIFAGFRGDFIVYDGANTSNGMLSSKVKKIPLLSRGDYTEVYPGAINMWRSLIHFGAVANSSSTTLTRAVYSWGTINKLYPETLSLDYPISTGSTGTSVKIGLVYPVGQTLLVGWQDGASYGCDQVNFSNRPASYGTIESLLMDGGQVWKQNLTMKVRSDHKTLLTGESIVTKYKLDRESNWETTGSITDTSGQFTMINVPNGRGKEYQFAVDMYSTNGTSPTLLEISGLVDDTEGESQY